MQYTFKEKIQCVSGTGPTGYIALAGYRVDTWNDVRLKTRSRSTRWRETTWRVGVIFSVGRTDISRTLRYRQCVPSYRRTGGIKMTE